MLEPRRPRPLVAAVSAVAAVTALVAACGVEAPSSASAPRAAKVQQLPTQGVAEIKVHELPAVSVSDDGVEGAFFEFQVEKPVQPLPGGSAVRYPDALRKARVEGEILAQFVVDTAGRAEVATYKVLKVSHEEFAAAVRVALPGFTYSPAEVKGRKVRQLVQQPFTFALASSDRGDAGRGRASERR